MSDLSANVGLNAAANKQYAVVRQAQSFQKKAEESPSSTAKVKGQVSDNELSEMANPTLDSYILALAEEDEASKTKKRYQPTVESLKERLAKALEDKHDNAHNMLAEGFYGFQVSTCSAMLGLLNADPAELEDIRRQATENAKLKVKSGFQRLASAYAEFEIYAS